MTIEERAAQAAQYKETGACNCTPGGDQGI